MVSIETFKELALALPEVTEAPHFEKASFRAKKRIFATLSIDKHLAFLKLTEIDQSVYCAIDNTIIYPVNNKWGKQGWTTIELDKVKKNLLKDALTLAYQHVLSKGK